VNPRKHLGLIVGLAAVLRLVRAACRWEEWAWRYSAYPGPTVDALEAGDMAVALTTFTGLHPPLWPLLHAASELLLPVPALWLLGGALVGTMGVALVARRAPLAGLLLATSPVALHYTAEVNDYPLLFALVCAVLVAREAAADGRAHWGWLALAGALAGWTHALGGVVALVAAASLGRRALPILATLAVAALPLIPGVVEVLGEGGATTQPPFKAGLVAADALARFGPGPLLLLAIALLGARRWPALAATLLLPAAALAALIAAGVAAPHQFPYLVVLVPPAAMLAARTAEAPALRGALVLLAIAHAGWAAVAGGGTLHGLIGDPGDRAIDVAINSLGPGHDCAAGAPTTPSCGGDALVLIAGGGGNDDDKRRSSPVLWRLRPWQEMPRLTGLPGDWADHRRGHPRRVGGHAVYVFEHVRPELADVIAAHPRTMLVVYGDGPRQRFLSEVERIAGVGPTRVGPDHLFEVTPAQ
jgi:hypothetical protein